MSLLQRATKRLCITPISSHATRPFYTPYINTHNNIHTTTIQYAQAKKVIDTVAPPKQYPITNTDLDYTESLMPDVINTLQQMNVNTEQIDYIKKITALSTGSRRNVMHAKLELYRKRYSENPADTGNVTIQAAALIERVENMRRHLRDRNSDIFARKTLNTLLNKRRKLLLYMRKNHWVEYRRIMLEFGLNENELFIYGVNEKSGQQAQRQRIKF